MQETLTFTSFFKDAQLQQQYEENGYVVIKKFIDKDKINKLLQAYRQFSDFGFEEFHASNYAKNMDTNMFVNKAVQNILVPVIAEKIKNFRPLIGLFYIKPPTKKSSFHIHSDWSLVDERFYSSINVWVALCNVDATNGNLFVFEKSHLVKNIRGCPNFEYPKETLFTKLLGRKGKADIFFEEGDAVIFDHRIKHGSNRNKSIVTRIAAAVSVLPVNAPLVHYYKHKNGAIEMFEVEDDFYLKYDLSSAPVNAISKGFVAKDFFKSTHG